MTGQKDKTSTNPYMVAQREWDERFAFHAATAQRFFRLGLAGMVMGAVGLGFGIWAASQSEYVPYLVKVDDLGRAEALAQPTTISEWPTAVVKRELQRFIERARSIPADRAVLERNLWRLYRFMRTDSPAFRILSEAFQANGTNPMIRWNQETVFVRVTSVSYSGGSSWRVEWSERTSARLTGENLSEKRYVGILVLGDPVSVSREALEANPLGLMVNHIDIQRVRTDGE
ncbi:MAG: VirB8/TrbF family protein [Rhodobacteraceae bacterium]|nr:VirB8/TrbF family protein [Paracoccaceae bacterium]MCY4141207.1 VirB8/TrbF family protein [Paracoccaceae bacterium]